MARVNNLSLAHRSALRVVVIAAAVSMAMSSCSLRGDEAGVEPVVPSTATTPPPDLAFVEDKRAPLRLALVRPETTDPVRLSLGDQTAVLVADLLHDGLTEASANGALRPGLAVSWEAAADFKTWTFQLDTRRTSANDVVDSFARLRAEAAATAAAVLLHDVDAVVAVSDDVVRFELAESDAGFAWLLSGVQYSVVSEPATGRYSLSQGDESTSMLTGDGLLDIEIHWQDSDTAAAEQLENAVVDGAIAHRVASDQATAPRSSRAATRFYGLNMASPDLQDPAIREGVVAAIDRAALVELLPVAGLPSNGVAAPSIAGAGGDVCGQACAADVEKAALLLQAAAADTAILVAFVNEGQTEVAAEIAASLQVRGLTADTRQVAAEDLPALIADGTADIFAFGWAAPASSLDAVVAPLFGSDSALNVTRMVVAAVDDLLDQASVTGDDATRWSLLRDAEEAALGHWVVVPVAAAVDELVFDQQASFVSVRADGSIDVQSLVES